MTDRFKISSLLAPRLAERGLNLPALLRHAGLPLGFFDQPKVFATTAELFSLWRAIGEVSSNPAIGLQMGVEPRFERHHPTAILAVCSENLRDALQRISRYKRLTCPEEIRVETKKEEAVVEFVYLQADGIQPDILVDLALSWIMSIGKRGTDGQVGPIRLELTRPAGNRELLESHFGCRVRFKAPRNAIVYQNRDLDRAFVTSNSDLREVIGAQLEAELRDRSPSQDVGEQVKRCLKRSLAGKRPTLGNVARELGLSDRTLQRRLTNANLSFQQLVEETRRDLARHYLKHSALELNETAFLLGFADANSFFRAFHCWEGTTPGEWRQRNQTHQIGAQALA